MWEEGPNSFQARARRRFPQAPHAARSSSACHAAGPLAPQRACGAAAPRACACAARATAQLDRWPLHFARAALTRRRRSRISAPLQPSQPILRAAVDAGLKDELVFGDPEAPRFVFWENKLRPVPGGPAVRRLARAGRAPAAAASRARSARPRRTCPCLTSCPSWARSARGWAPWASAPARRATRSPWSSLCAATWCVATHALPCQPSDRARAQGDEVFERLIEPFCSGVYAARCTAPSLRACAVRLLTPLPTPSSPPRRATPPSCP